MDEKPLETIIIDYAPEEDVEQPFIGDARKSKRSLRLAGPSPSTLSLLCSFIFFLASVVVLYFAKHTTPSTQQCVEEVSAYCISSRYLLSQLAHLHLPSTPYRRRPLLLLQFQQ